MPAWWEIQCWLLIGTIMLHQPEDRVKTWSPAFIYNLAEYVQNFRYIGQIIPKFDENQTKKSEDGMTSIDDIIPI